MSNVTSDPDAGDDRLTVKVAVTVPLFPSVTMTSSIVKLGGVPPEQLFAGAELLRGNGVEARKSAPLSFVSTQPPAFRKSALVFPGAGALVEFSEQSAVLP